MRSVIDWNNDNLGALTNKFGLRVNFFFYMYASILEILSPVDETKVLDFLGFAKYNS